MWQGVRKAINNNTKSSNQSEKKAFTTFISVWGVFDEKVKDRFAWVDHHNERDAGLLAHQQCVAMWYPSTWSSPAKSLYEQTILCAIQQLLRDWSLIAAITLWQTFVYPFRNREGQHLRLETKLLSPFQSVNDLALSRADMIHTTINVGHVMCLQPANFRGLHERPSFRPRLSVSLKTCQICLAKDLCMGWHFGNSTDQLF